MKEAFFLIVTCFLCLLVLCWCIWERQTFLKCMHADEGQAPRISNAVRRGRGAAVRAYPRQRDALIETCCQSDKHICIQSIYFRWKGLQSAVG